jgi:hypothetical protein
VGQNEFNVLLDENIKKPEETIAWLKTHRPHWHVEHVVRIGLDGRPDKVVFQHAQQREALFITADKDFLEVREFSREHGILLLRPFEKTAKSQRAALQMR